MPTTTPTHRALLILGACFVVVVLLAAYFSQGTTEEYDIGFVGPITGASAKYGAFEAVTIAVEEINARGGVRGKRLNLIAEDGQCSTAVAANAVNKLVNVDKVKIILGGHCTPESAMVARAAGEHKIVALASITSSPMFTAINPYFARTTWLSTQQASVITEYLLGSTGVSKLAVVHEQTDYARPIAETVKAEYEGGGGTVVAYESFAPNTNDFRSVLTKVKASGAQAVFISTQSPDATMNLMKQIKELDLGDVKILGNDILNVQVNIDSNPGAYEDVMFASPAFDITSERASRFVNAYKEKYNVDNIPAGILTAESYDAVYIMADALEKYDLDVEKIAAHLRTIDNFQGASGGITIDRNGDGIRTYQMRIIKSGKVRDL